MAKQIFRQEAMDRMASPDRLDQPVQLVRNKQWLLLGCFAAVVLFVLIWSFFASLPIKVSGRGILIDPAGLSEITIASNGRVNEILVTPGDVVTAGDVIARMTRNIKQHDIDIAKAELAAAIESAEKSATAYAQSKQRYRKVDRQRLSSITTRATDLREQLETREKLADDLRALVTKGAVTPLELVGVVTAIDALEEALRQLEQERLEIQVAEAERSDARARSELSEQQAVQRRQLELERMQAETDDAIDITTFQAGRIAEIKVNVGDALTAGKALALLNPNPAEQRLQAVLFLPSTQGKKVQKGMAVEVMPSTAEKEIYGHIKATVISAAPLPASRDGMRRLLQNDRLIDELSAAGPPIQVMAELTIGENASGFSWSSSSGPPYPITSGTLLDAKVVVERRAIINVILPGLRERVQHSINGD